MREKILKNSLASKALFGVATVAIGGTLATSMGALAQKTTHTGDPKTKADCMNGGWQTLGFKNQGQCVSFVERNDKGHGYGYREGDDKNDNENDNGNNNGNGNGNDHNDVSLHNGNFNFDLGSFHWNWQFPHMWPFE